MLPDTQIIYNPFDLSWTLQNGKVHDVVTIDGKTLTAFPLALEAARQHPQLTTRLWKAALIVNAADVVTVKNPGGRSGAVVAQARSQADGEKTYTITQVKPSAELSAPFVKEEWILVCQCKDYQHNAPRMDKRPQQKLCKHILAYSLQHELDKRTAPAVPAEDAAAAPSWFTKRYSDMSEAERADFYAYQGKLDTIQAAMNRARWQTYAAMWQKQAQQPPTDPAPDGIHW